MHVRNSRSKYSSTNLQQALDLCQEQLEEVVHIPFLDICHHSFSQKESKSILSLCQLCGVVRYYLVGA